MSSVLRIKADLASLPSVREHVLANASAAELPDGSEHKLDLVIEEILVNIANHAYGEDGGPMEVECHVRDKAFCCVFRDWGPPFNPLDADTPQLDQSVEERPIGGLGIFLAITAPDKCTYSRHNDANELTFCFSLRN